MNELRFNCKRWWMAIGGAVLLGVAVGLALRPYGTQSSARAAAISAMQIITIFGVASVFASRLPLVIGWMRWVLPMVATGGGLLAGGWGMLSAANIGQLILAGALWNMFLLGLGSATAGSRRNSVRFPLVALAVCLTLPLWPIAAAPLINAASNGATGVILSFIFSLCPSIWVIHITQQATGMNAMVWFHTQLMYRVVPLGQNVLIPKATPWLLVAGGLGLLGAGVELLATWRQNRPA